MEMLGSTVMTDLRIEYTPLSDCRRWDRNPKRHALPTLIESIQRYGFRDAPIFDQALGAIVAGNGRIAALERLRQQGHEPPAGVRVAEDGEWLVPIQLGLDAKNRAEAEAFGIDHNQLTVAPLDPADAAGIWEEETLEELLGDLEGQELGPVALGLDDVADPIEEDDADPSPQLGDLDYQLIVTCRNEEHQAELLKRFEGEGLSCRALIS